MDLSANKPSAVSHRAPYHNVTNQELKPFAALHRSGWRDIYEDGLEAAHHHQQLMPSQEQVLCQGCKRMFRREADRALHKCVTE